MGSNGWEYVTNFCVVEIAKSSIYFFIYRAYKLWLLILNLKQNKYAMLKATGAIIIFDPLVLFKNIGIHCTPHAHASRSTAAARRRCIFVVCIRCNFHYMFYY